MDDIGAGDMAGRRALDDRRFWSLAAALVFLAYLVTLKFAAPNGWRAAAVASLVNLVSLAIVAAPFRLMMLRYAPARGAMRQLAFHTTSATLFSLLWYWLMMVLIGLSGGASLMHFDVRPSFADAATLWQLLQGLTLYALLAALLHARAVTAMPTFVLSPSAQADDAAREGAMSRYFIRRGDEIHPIDVSSIVCIAGADDYAEVVTVSERHLVRMTLGDFEKVLDGARFMRIHRSHIVNVERIERAEPAGGGRLLLHMDNGETLQASRTGTRLLRDRVL